MRIEELDTNFATKSVEYAGDKAIYSIPHEKFDLYGVAYDRKRQRFTRLIEDKEPELRADLYYLGKRTAGGRLRFSTDSKYFGIDVVYEKLSPMAHMPLSGSCGFTLLLEEEDGTLVRMAGFRPETVGCENGYSRTATLPGGKMRNYILHFPLYHAVDSLKITLSAEAKVDHGKKYKELAPILYYGSSITQGGCASRPDNAYQGLIAKWNNVDFINLGFSGHAKAEDETVDYLAGIDCSLFVCDYDHNAPNAEYLESTHYRLYERYRAVRKDTPILFISKPDLYQAQRKEFTQTQGVIRVEEEPDWQNAIKRKAVIFQTYQKAKQAGDNNVYFLDGAELFGNEDWDNCTVDGCHPNDLGFYRMAKRMYAEMIKISPIFKGEKND